MEKTMHQELVEMLLSCERYTPQDVFNKYQLPDRDMKLALWGAEEELRSDHGIDFRPGVSGSRERASLAQTISRSRRQRKAGLRKLERAALKMEIAGASDANAQLAAERQRLQLTAAKIRSSKRLSAA